MSAIKGPERPSHIMTRRKWRRLTSPVTTRRTHARSSCSSGPMTPFLSRRLLPVTLTCHASAPRLPVSSYRGRAEVLTLVEPGEVGLVALEETGHGIHEDVVGRHRSQPTRLFQGQDALHPSIALGTGRPQRALAPEYPTTQRPLRPVVGRLDTVVGRKHP